MNYTKKSILRKITKDFGRKIQDLPRKRKKNVKKLFFDGLINVEVFQLVLMLQFIGRSTRKELPKGYYKDLLVKNKIEFMELPIGFGKALTPFGGND